MAGGRSRGLTLQPVPARPSGGAAPSRTFPVLSSAVCVIRGMELWYACTIDGAVRIVKLWLFARIVRQPEGVARTIRATRRAIGGLRHPPAAQGPSLWPSLLSVLRVLRHGGASVTAPGHWRSFGGRVWSPSTLDGRPSARRPGCPRAAWVWATTPGTGMPPGVVARSDGDAVADDSGQGASLLVVSRSISALHQIRLAGGWPVTSAPSLALF